MSFTPGFQHDDYTVLGIVEDVDWSEWDVRAQKAGAFGVDGCSVIEGGIEARQFSFSMIIYGYTTPGDRDYVMMQIELKIGTVGNLLVNIPAYQIFNLDNIRLKGVKPGKCGADPVRGFWRRLYFVFEQLMPIEELESSSGGTWSFGNGLAGNEEP